MQRPRQLLERLARVRGAEVAELSGRVIQRLLPEHRIAALEEDRVRDDWIRVAAARADAVKTPRLRGRVEAALVQAVRLDVRREVAAQRVAHLRRHGPRQDHPVVRSKSEKDLKIARNWRVACETCAPSRCRAARQRSTTLGSSAS